MNELFGRVKDADNGLPLWAAHVYTMDENGAILQGTTTDHLGYFHLSNYDARAVTVRFVGYHSQTFTPTSTDMVNVYLARNVIELGEVEIFSTDDGPAILNPEIEVPTTSTDPPPTPGGWTTTQKATAGAAAFVLLLALAQE